MCPFFRMTFTILGMAFLVASFGSLSSGQVLAQTSAQQGQLPAVKQISLTENQIQNFLAAQKEMNAITDKLPENVQPDAKTIAQLGAIAKKRGFADYEDYNTVLDNITLVLGGIDPQTKKYIGSDAVLRQQIEQVKADKQMTAADKKEALANLDMATKAKAPEVQYKGNIDLVIKNYDKLSAALGAGGD